MIIKSDSRYRKAENLYDAFYVFELKNDNIDLIKKYPPDLIDDKNTEVIKQFCFPKKLGTWKSTDPLTYFTFALTDNEALHTYGHCRFSPSKNICMCILTSLPDLSFFKAVLCSIADAKTLDAEKFLQYLYCSPIPFGEEQINYHDLRFSQKICDCDTYHNSLSDKKVARLYNDLSCSTNNLISLYTSLIKERKILITSKKIDSLSTNAFAILRLIYPFHWQGIFVPVLPYSILDQIQAPMPYIIGVPKENLQDINLLECGDLVILDIDAEDESERFRSDTIDILPDVLYKYILKQLKAKDLNWLMNPEILIDSFTKCTVILFGMYRAGLCNSPKLTWKREKFLAIQPPELKPFIQDLVGKDGVQYFERFVDVRIEALEKGTAFMEMSDRLMRNAVEYWSEAEACKNFKDTLQDAVKGMKKNTNVVFGNIKGTVKGALKNRPSFTPKIKRKKNYNQQAYSFTPPILSKSPLKEDNHINFDDQNRQSNSSSKESGKEEELLIRQDIDDIPLINFDDNDITSNNSHQPVTSNNTGSLNDFEVLLRDIYKNPSPDSQSMPGSNRNDNAITNNLDDLLKEIYDPKTRWETFD